MPEYIKLGDRAETEDKEMPVLNFTSRPARDGDFTPGRGGHTVQNIIIHSSCGREGGDLQTLTGHDPGHLVSSHWYIDRAGQIFHLVDNANTAFHAGVVTENQFSNACTIGIEQEHFDPDEDHPDGEDWPEAQIQSAARLIVALRQQAGTELPVKTHAEVASPPGRKVDPVNYPFDRLHEFAVAAAAEGDFTFQQVA